MYLQLKIVFFFQLGFPQDTIISKGVVLYFETELNIKLLERIVCIKSLRNLQLFRAVT